jgi:hypothetical protein
MRCEVYHVGWKRAWRCRPLDATTPPHSQSLGERQFLGERPELNARAKDPAGSMAAGSTSTARARPALDDAEGEELGAVALGPLDVHLVCRTSAW